SGRRAACDASQFAADTAGHSRETSKSEIRIRLAEGVGFEPTRACALPVFKTGAINHSTTPPNGGAIFSCLIGRSNPTATAKRALDFAPCSGEHVEWSSEIRGSFGKMSAKFRKRRGSFTHAPTTPAAPRSIQPV